MARDRKKGRAFKKAKGREGRLNGGWQGGKEVGVVLPLDSKL